MQHSAGDGDGDGDGEGDALAAGYRGYHMVMVSFRCAVLRV